MGQSELILDEIYDIWYTPWWQTSFGYAIIIGLVFFIGALTLCLFLFWLKRRSGTPYKTTIKELRALSKLSCNNLRAAQQVYNKLTGSLKRYIAAQYDMSMEGATDYECITVLQKLLKDDRLIAPVDNLMRNAQAVKFAHAMVLEKQIKEDIAHALLFVEQAAVAHNHSQEKR